MFCSKCGTESSTNNKLCLKCGATLNPTIKENNIQANDKNINIIGNGNLSNANININDYNIQGEDSTNFDFKITETLNYKIPIKPLWTFIASLMSLITTILKLLYDAHTIMVQGYSALNQHDENPILIFFIIGISVILIHISKRLIQTNFFWLKGFGLKVDQNEFIHLINLTGTCPICSRNLSIKYVNINSIPTLCAVCTKNPDQHIFIFDYTNY
ncbi:MAG: zinc ribbon domain-containing protein [Candidatus Omnitrophica bacterium]|nr:zinc ribbon domain-containing protein [Candidatus Omnitrophota bacterium]